MILIPDRFTCINYISRKRKFYVDIFSFRKKKINIFVILMPDRFTCVNYISRNFYFLILKSSKSNESSDIEVNESKSKNLLE